jgi:hypothetical protein
METAGTSDSPIQDRRTVEEGEHAPSYKRHLLPVADGVLLEDATHHFPSLANGIPLLHLVEKGWNLGTHP